jgi:AcrR family transcriptional regulator
MSTSGGKYHHGELAAALVQAALDLLADDGVDAVSLRAVARRAGVSAMAPYRHFPNKEALLAAVAVQGFHALRTTLLAADRAAQPGQALIEQAVAYVAFALANPAMIRLMFGPRHTGLHTHLDATGQTAFAVLATRVASETPDTADRQASAFGCWSLVHGLAMLLLDGRLAGQTNESTEDFIRRIASAMLYPWQQKRPDTSP